MPVEEPTAVLDSTNKVGVNFGGGVEWNFLPLLALRFDRKLRRPCEQKGRGTHKTTVQATHKETRYFLRAFLIFNTAASRSVSIVCFHSLITRHPIHRSLAKFLLSLSRFFPIFFCQKGERVALHC